MSNYVDSKGPVEVGMLVYVSYSPAKCGKIIKDEGLRPTEPHGLTYRHALVRWHNGEEEVISMHRLGNFNQLIKDHKRKYEKHLATAEKLKAL